jgi:hypothetical protein
MPQWERSTTTRPSSAFLITWALSTRDLASPAATSTRVRGVGRLSRHEYGRFRWASCARLMSKKSKPEPGSVLQDFGRCGHIR